jgi:dipeptidyl aminopeptidase/acylaminoacyl peptidase
MVSVFALALAATASPPVAQTATKTITTKMLVESANISGLAVSPDGARVAYRIVRGSVDQDNMVVEWHVAPTDGRSPVQRVAMGGEALFNYAGSVAEETPVWSPDSRTLFFRARLNGAVQIWSVGLDAAAKQVTDDPADVVGFSVSDDGRILRYQVGAPRADIRHAEQQVYDNGMLVDGTTDLALPVAGGLVVDGERVMLRYTGDWFERVPLLHDTPSTTKSITLETAAAPVPAPVAPPGKIRIVTGNATAKIFVDLRDGRSIECPARACGAAPVSAVWIPGRNTLLVSNENSHVTLSREPLGRTWLRVWEVGAPTARILVEQPGTLAGSRYSSVPCGLTHDTAFCVSGSAGSPPRLVAVDLRSGQQNVIDDPNPVLRRAIGSTIRQVDWQVGDRKHHGELLLPSGRKGPFPLVLYYYTSRGFLAGAFGEALPVQPLVQNGIAVLVMDKPLLGEAIYNSERNYQIALEGITAIVDRLVREGTVDRGRIGAWGFSFGSEVANRLMRRTNLLKVASLASLQVSEAYYWANAFPGKDMQERQKQEFGTDWPDRAPETWAKIAPSKNTASLSIPVLFQMPEDEARWMGEFVSSALRDGKPVELYAFADETHMPMHPRHKRAALERNLDWFRYWLTNQRDADPAKAAQYARWDKLSAIQTGKPVDRTNP